MTSKGPGTPDHLASQLGFVHIRGAVTHCTKCVEDCHVQPLGHAWTLELIWDILSRQILAVGMDLPSLCENLPSRCEGDEKKLTRHKMDTHQSKGMAGETQLQGGEGVK